MPSKPVFASCLLLLGLLPYYSATSQSRSANDGFQRQNGSMYIIRNGMQRPMTRDVHLPNGRTITRDGFVIARDGSRTELAEGRGCTLSGAVVAVQSGTTGQLLLTAAPRPHPSAVAEADAAAYLRPVFAGGKPHGWGRHKKGKHGKGKGPGRGKKHYD